MGVWIETTMAIGTTTVRLVTPCMGVWIETRYLQSLSDKKSGHTLYGCVD